MLPLHTLLTLHAVQQEQGRESAREGHHALEQSACDIVVYYYHSLLLSQLMQSSLHAVQREEGRQPTWEGAGSAELMLVEALLRGFEAHTLLPHISPRPPSLIIVACIRSSLLLLLHLTILLQTLHTLLLLLYLTIAHPAHSLLLLLHLPTYLHTLHTACCAARGRSSAYVGRGRQC